jgi:hypothetical protein
MEIFILLSSMRISQAEEVLCRVKDRLIISLVQRMGRGGTIVMSANVELDSM